MKCKRHRNRFGQQKEKAMCKVRSVSGVLGGLTVFLSFLAFDPQAFAQG